MTLTLNTHITSLTRKAVCISQAIKAHAAYDMFSKYKYLIVNLVFPTSVFGVGISF